MSGLADGVVRKYGGDFHRYGATDATNAQRDVELSH